MRLDGCTALITGASAGIGREFARQLAGRVRAALALVARRRDRLEELRDELTHARSEPRTCTSTSTDLSRADEVNGFAMRWNSDGFTVDLLINNAGLGDHGDFATSDPQRLNEIVLVNVVVADCADAAPACRQ